MILGRANYVLVIDGQFELVFGTSASSPVVGSMITMINDARLAVGKGPVGESRDLFSMHEDSLFKLVGFINPAIYSSQFANAFNDITAGNNPGCGTCSYFRVNSLCLNARHKQRMVLLRTYTMLL